MSFVLYDHQNDLKSQVWQQWNSGVENVLMRLDTGGGKTAILSKILEEMDGRPSAVLAHRNEIVGQLSLALARNGIYHDLCCAKKMKAVIARAQQQKLGKLFLREGNRTVVGSVPTLLRAKNMERWANQVEHWTIDEAHHLVLGNMWGKALDLFPKKRWGLGPTASPRRSDRKGLGRPELGGSGVFDVMVQGKPMRWLIDNGYLTDYDIAVRDSDLADIKEKVAASGDWSPEVLRKAAKKSKIVGDVVQHYLELAKGRLGITFATDVETATEIKMNFIANGVPAEILVGETDIDVRQSIIARFERRELLQIIAVDVVSEGFDLPAIEVASFARPTASLVTYLQQFGRCLRTMAGKTRALIIDHVGNFHRHGAPDMPRLWGLTDEGGTSRGASDSIPSRVCLNPLCAMDYMRILPACPYCHTEAPEPEGRASPEMVEGKLRLLTPDILAIIRKEAEDRMKASDELHMDLLQKRMPVAYIGSHINKHEGDREAQVYLRQVLAQWGGYRRADGLSDDQIQQVFYYRFGIDVLSAQGLRASAAATLAGKVILDYTNSKL